MGVRTDRSCPIEATAANRSQPPTGGRQTRIVSISRDALCCESSNYCASLLWHIRSRAARTDWAGTCWSGSCCGFCARCSTGPCLSQVWPITRRSPGRSGRKCLGMKRKRAGMTSAPLPRSLSTWPRGRVSDTLHSHPRPGEGGHCQRPPHGDPCPRNVGKRARRFHILAARALASVVLCVLAEDVLLTPSLGWGTYTKTRRTARNHSPECHHRNKPHSQDPCLLSAFHHGQYDCSPGRGSVLRLRAWLRVAGDGMPSWAYNQVGNPAPPPGRCLFTKTVPLVSNHGFFFFSRRRRCLRPELSAPI